MTQDSTDIPEMTALELKERLDNGDAPVLVDVRELFEHRIADLPEQGQIRIPVAQLAARAEELERTRDVVLYCRSGARSAWAVRLLRSRGFDNVLNLKGGVLGWRADVDPSLRKY